MCGLVDEVGDAAFHARSTACSASALRWRAAQAIARTWRVFFTRCEALLMPVSWGLAPVSLHDQGGQKAMTALVNAQSLLLATAGFCLPGLSVPTGFAAVRGGHIPAGVQIVGPRVAETMLCAVAVAAVFGDAFGLEALATA